MNSFNKLEKGSAGGSYFYNEDESCYGPLDCFP